MTRPADMADTGRIGHALAREAQRIYYGAPDAETDLSALELIARVDRAHLVMLAESGILARSAAAHLLRTVEAVQQSGFVDVLGQPRPRGLYLAYEQAISRSSSPEIGGLLHTARSRNDLLATTTLLALRRSLLTVLAQGCRLLTALLSAAARHLDVVMPIHTHHQPAMPITFGYYLTGVALAVHRDIERLLGVLEQTTRCPLGAHAVAGTGLPIDPERTAQLLGFETGPLHAVDAVASRDASIWALAGIVTLTATISRLATDLQFWSSADVGYLEFPDWLVGSSSAMPQKRNVFLLEYLRARPARVVGALVSSLTAMSGTPFTNSIEVGTEAVSGVPGALVTSGDVLAVAALVCAGAIPRPEAMRTAATRGLVDATAYADDLVRSGIPFRQAHARIGAAAALAVQGTGPWPPDGVVPLSLDAAVDLSRHGGGPGTRSACLAAARERRHHLRERIREQLAAEQLARRRLRQAVEDLTVG